MDSLDLCLPKALAELNLLEQYKLNTLVHKWRDVVGDVIADHTKIVSIKPPDMVISADNSMWMQELQMQKRRIIEAINKYYRQEVITDIRFIMKRQSYVKEKIKRLSRFLMNRLLQNVLIFLISCFQKKT